MKKIYLVGIGPGSLEYLSLKALDHIKQAQTVFAFNRVKDLFKDINNNIQEVKLMDITTKIEASDEKEVSILLSGDINFYSASKYLQRNLNNQDYEYELIPGLTSYQVLCAKINISYENLKLLSLHGKDVRYLGVISGHKHTFMLCDSLNNVTKILNDLKHLTNLKAYIGENLGMPDEVITCGYVKDLLDKEYSVLSCLIIENDQAIDLNATLYDEDYIRTKVPMTKQEIRWLVLSLLDLKTNDIVYDVGAGSGSVTVALARKVSQGHVYALEKKEDAYDLINENIKSLHAYNVTSLYGSAYELLDNLEACNKVFIGGSGHDLDKIIKKIITKNNEITFVITCITLETQNQAMTTFNELEIEYDVMSINSARSKKVASYNMMYANNPITIIKGVYKNV